MRQSTETTGVESTEHTKNSFSKNMRLMLMNRRKVYLGALKNVGTFKSREIKLFSSLNKMIGKVKSNFFVDLSHHSSNKKSLSTIKEAERLLSKSNKSINKSNFQSMK